MGNRVVLELLAGDAATPQEPLVALACNNGLPLFWLALLSAEALERWWPGASAALADPRGEAPVPPLVLEWPEAQAQLQHAVARATTRWPAAASRLAAWAAAMQALGGGAARVVRLDLAEHSGFYPDAASWLLELRQGVALWHGEGPAAPPPIQDAAMELTGYDAETDMPFPASAVVQPAMPAAEKPRGGVAAATGLLLAMALAAGWAGHAWAGAPFWGGGLGLALGAAGVWLRARR